ncbi:MAG: methyltransferase, partial [Trichodesmium sp.]
MNAEKNEINYKLITDKFIQDQTRNPEIINSKIHPQDEMYLYALQNVERKKEEALLRYFSNGKRIFDAVKQIVEWYFESWQNVSSFLDFASGYGRFSRFLIEEIPVNKVWVSDIYAQAVEFQKQEFGYQGIVSTNNPENYQVNKKFDCIFACSFFSHIPQKTFASWLEKLYSLLTEKGILIFSTHDLSLMTVEVEKDGEEIYFTPESESLYLNTEDYGVTYVGEKWVGKVIEQVTQGKVKWNRIKKGLCGYHDLYILWNNQEIEKQTKEVERQIVQGKEVREKKEIIGEQRDELLNFSCHPDGGCQLIKITSTRDIYIEGWAADINPQEKVEKIEVLIREKEIVSCLPKYDSQTHKYDWSCTLNTEILSTDDIILVKIINNFNLERVVKIFAVKSILLFPPKHLLLRISGNPSPKAFINSFDDLRYTVKNYLQTAELNFNQFENILDFGCGVGRYLMAFEPELLPHQKLFGCDVFAECAEWCQENIEFATVKNNNIQPPLPFENNQFDLINAISVFTHLSLDLQHLWAWDIYRVLRPGGILFMTLHGPQFFPIIYDIFRSGNAHQAEMYSIGEEGLFLYLDHQGEVDGQGQHTIAAVHTPAAYQEIFSMFKHIKRFPQSNLANGQDLYILQKPISGSLVAQPLSIKSKFKSQNSKVRNQTLEVENLGKEEEVANTKEEIIGNIDSEVATQKLEVENFGKEEDLGNVKEEIIGNIDSEVATQKLEVNNFAKEEEVGNVKEEIIGNIDSEVRTKKLEVKNFAKEVVTKKLEVKNFAKEEDLGNTKEEIIGNIDSQVATKKLEVENLGKEEEVANTKEEIIWNIDSEVATQKLEVENLGKEENLGNVKEEIIGNIDSQVATKKLEVKNFAKEEDLGNTKEEIIGNIDSQVATKKLEVENFDKEQEVGNVKEEIIGKNIEVEKIPISEKKEGEKLSDKILSDSQTKERVTTKVEELLLSNDGKTENLSDKILSETQRNINSEVRSQKLEINNFGKKGEVGNTKEKILISDRGET